MKTALNLSATSELYEHDSKEEYMMVIHSQRSSQLIHADRRGDAWL